MTVSVAGGGLGTRPHRQPAGMVEGLRGEEGLDCAGFRVRARAGRGGAGPLFPYLGTFLTAAAISGSCGLERWGFCWISAY